MPVLSLAAAPNAVFRSRMDSSRRPDEEFVERALRKRRPPAPVQQRWQRQTFEASTTLRKFPTWKNAREPQQPLWKAAQVPGLRVRIPILYSAYKELPRQRHWAAVPGNLYREFCAPSVWGVFFILA